MSTPDRSASELLPPELLDGIAGLDLVARTIVRGFISGAHRSPFLGSGEDFSRHRAYQQGDDVRRLDWRLYGRTDRLYLRLFEETSNLQGMIVVDTSASMGFRGNGAVSKLRYAQFLAAAIAHVMLRGGDATGLASFTDETTFHLPPRNRPGQLHDLLVALSGLEATPQGRTSPGSGVGPGGGTVSMAESLSEVGAALRRRGRVVLLSDCLADDDGAELYGAVAQLRARGDEVIVVRIATEDELGIAPPGAARYYDPERPERTVDAVPAEDAGFAARVAGYFDDLRRGLEEQGAEFVPLVTSTPLVTALSTWLAARRRGGGALTS